MNPDRWAQVKDLFYQAIEKPADRQAAFLAEACDSDDALRAEIERLLTAHAAAGRFIETSPVAPLSAPVLTLGPSMTGRVVTHYEIGELLGAGGVGEVYAARDLELKREVAIKVVTRADRSAQRELKREAQHASRLNHPNICTIHEVGMDGEQAYVVMELVGGRPLDRMVGEAPLPIDVGIGYGLQIAEALAHAHQNGVVHGDLKSANVVVTPGGRTKVLDFGLARRLPTAQVSEWSQSHEPLEARPLAGTLAYMAPELLRGQTPNPQTDLWALGVMLYELSAGHRPFSGTTPFELSAAILHERPRALPASVPARLQSIIERCLSKDPGARYASAQEVSAALAAVQTEPSSDGEPTPASWRRSRTAAMALIVLLVLVAGAVMALRRGRPPAPVAIGAGGRPAIAVMSFTNVSGAPDMAWLSNGIPSMLLTGLAQTRGLDVVSEQRLHQELEQMGVSRLDALARGQIAEVARRTGAGAVLEGSVARAASEIRIDARLEDLSTGRVLVAETVRGADLFALVDQLATRIRDNVGLRQTAGARGVADVSSSSLEAYRLYAEGKDAYVNFRFNDARNRLKQAIEIDPNFAEAYLQLTFVEWRNGRDANWRKTLDEAGQRTDRLTEGHRLLLEVLRALADGDTARAVRTVEEIVQNFPDVEEAYQLIGDIRTNAEPSLYDEKVLAIAKAGATALPTSPQVRDTYGYALLAVGRYADAVREFEAYRRLAPREANPEDSLGDGYLLMGAGDQALQAYTRANTIDPSLGWPRVKRVWVDAMFGRYGTDLDAVKEWRFLPTKAILLSRAGRYREASDVIGEWDRATAANRNHYVAGAIPLVSAMLAFERQDYTRAVADAEASRASFEQIPVNVRWEPLALADALRVVSKVRASHMQDARVALEMHKSVPFPAPTRHWSQMLDGEVALADGHLQAAATAFAAGEPPRRAFDFVAGSYVANSLIFRDGPARVAKARGDLASAIQIYRRLLVYGPDSKWVSPFEPRYVLEIARLLDQTGDRQGARKEYERFLDLWKRADTDLPEVSEARQALARLPR
jgi:TolB-like protein/Tfp pilus assembly protein PilF